MNLTGLNFRAELLLDLCMQSQSGLTGANAPGIAQAHANTYGEAERLSGTREFQRLLDCVGAGSALPPAPRRARSVSPRRGARTDDSMAHSERLLNGSAVQVAAEIDVLRASQAARDAMASQRKIVAASDGVFGLRSALAASKAGVFTIATHVSRASGPLSTKQDLSLFVSGIRLQASKST